MRSRPGTLLSRLLVVIVGGLSIAGGAMPARATAPSPAILELITDDAPEGYRELVSDDVLSGPVTIEDAGIDEALLRNFKPDIELSIAARTWQSAEGFRLIAVVYQFGEVFDAGDFLRNRLISSGTVTKFDTTIPDAVALLVSDLDVPVAQITWQQGVYVLEVNAGGELMADARITADAMALTEVAHVTQLTGEAPKRVRTPPTDSGTNFAVPSPLIWAAIVGLVIWVARWAASRNARRAREARLPPVVDYGARPPELLRPSAYRPPGSEPLPAPPPPPSPASSRPSAFDEP
jgi:hypothetical protein